VRALAACLVLVALAGCGGSSKPHSPEYRLAQLDGVDPDGEDDPELGPYRASFAQLERICRDSRAAMADRAVAARDALHAMNIPDSTLAVLQEAADYAGGRKTATRRSCATDFAAALTALELNGK
jgi:hypothetical protein